VSAEQKWTIPPDSHPTLSRNNRKGLGGALFAAGSTGTLVDQFRYLPFTNVLPVVPGQIYFVTATYVSGDGDDFLVAAPGLFDPRTNFLESALGFGVGSPVLFGELGRFFGPNFLLASDDVTPIPIPAALPLFGSALAAMGIFRWWRRRRLVPA
jgi:hypothetical protein